MVSTISLPFFLKGRDQLESVYTPRKSGSFGERTPTTCSPCSSMDISTQFSAAHLKSSQGALAQLHEHYDIMAANSRMLGSGASGCVWSGTKRVGGRHVAVKIVDRPAYATFLHTESTILEQVQGITGVVRLYESFSDNDHEILVLELCHGRDLQSWPTGNLLTSQIQHILRELLFCVNQLHDFGISHGDLRLENVMVDLTCTDIGAERCPCVRLIDFGSSVDTNAEAYVDYVSAGKLLFELMAGYRTSSGEIVADSTHLDSCAMDLVRLLISTTNANYSENRSHALTHAWFSF